MARYCLVIAFVFPIVYAQPPFGISLAYPGLGANVQAPALPSSLFVPQQSFVPTYSLPTLPPVPAWNAYPNNLWSQWQNNNQAFQNNQLQNAQQTADFGLRQAQNGQNYANNQAHSGQQAIGNQNYFNGQPQLPQQNFQQNYQQNYQNYQNGQAQLPRQQQQNSYNQQQHQNNQQRNYQQNYQSTFAPVTQQPIPIQYDGHPDLPIPDTIINKAFAATQLNLKERPVDSETGIKMKITPSKVSTPEVREKDPTQEVLPVDEVPVIVVPELAFLEEDEVRPDGGETADDEESIEKPEEKHEEGWKAALEGAGPDGSPVAATPKYLDFRKVMDAQEQLDEQKDVDRILSNVLDAVAPIHKAEDELRSAA